MTLNITATRKNFSLCYFAFLGILNILLQIVKKKIKFFSFFNLITGNDRFGQKGKNFSLSFKLDLGGS